LNFEKERAKRLGKRRVRQCGLVIRGGNYDDMRIGHSIGEPMCVRHEWIIRSDDNR
jgi:hypothetical protein